MERYLYEEEVSWPRKHGHELGVRRWCSVVDRIQTRTLLESSSQVRSGGVTPKVDPPLMRVEVC
jgi:hypothetical protein